MPQVTKLTDERKKAIDNFLKEFTEEQFEQICVIANGSNFLVGKNDNGWKADFDFIIRTDKAISISEGKYNNSDCSKKSKNTNYEQRNYENVDNLYANFGKEECL